MWIPGTKFRSACLGALCHRGTSLTLPCPLSNKKVETSKGVSMELFDNPQHTPVFMGAGELAHGERPDDWTL